MADPVLGTAVPVMGFGLPIHLPTANDIAQSDVQAHGPGLAEYRCMVSTNTALAARSFSNRAPVRETAEAQKSTSPEGTASKRASREATRDPARRSAADRKGAQARFQHNMGAAHHQFKLHSMVSNDAFESPSDAPLPESAPGSDRFVDRALSNFDEWDSDSNGYLSDSEIANAVNDSDNTGADASAAAALHRNQDDLEELSNDEWGDENDGVTKRDLAEYNRQLDDGGTDVTRSTEFGYNDGNRRIRETSRELFNGEASTEHLRQGRNGTCDLVAAAGSIAAQDAGDDTRNRLEDMIQDNEDGTYTVNFPDQDPVTVDAPTDAEIARYSTAGENGLWMTVLEKAYGQNATFGSDVAGDAGSTALPGTAASNLSGGSDVDVLDLTGQATTRQKMTSAFAENRPVTAHMNRDMDPWGDNRYQGLPQGHAYSVTGYDPDTDTITLRNPWGRTEWTNEDGQPRDGVDDGTFTMTVEEFHNTFSNVAYGE